MDWLVALLIVAPAVILWGRRSTFLLDYLIWVMVLNRGVRRYVDWYAGSFNPLSPISLTPLVIGGLVGLSVLSSYHRLPRRVVRVLGMFAGALGVALCVGMLRNRLAAVYAFAEYVVPLSVMAMAALHGAQDKLLDRWIKTAGWAALVASVYGWYQYFTIPPWDAFWVESVGFVGYLGQLRPTEMAVFSTMHERGPFAWFLAWAVIPMIISQRWRNPLGWGGVVFIVLTLLLSYVRAAVVTVGLATLVFPMVNRGKGSGRVILAGALIVLGASFFLSKITGGDRIQERVESLRNLSSDGSYHVRLEIAQYGLITALRTPLGTGLGSVGLAGRANTGSMESETVIGDNGYFEIILTFGWLGAGLFFSALYSLWRQIRGVEQLGLGNETTMAAKSLFVVGGVVLYVSNWMSGPASFVFWMLVGYALIPVVSPAQKAALLKRLAHGERSGRVEGIADGDAAPQSQRSVTKLSP